MLKYLNTNHRTHGQTKTEEMNLGSLGKVGFPLCKLPLHDFTFTTLIFIKILFKETYSEIYGSKLKILNN